ncbi:hypothetical protein DOTSEDRAFT_22063 [Dothistroma septosporum NZE10]|uniref:Uncharacterized protein n=1 Tax=Dothistroma septosporum (strain NZE10 / CBS 128990) TaxID=675120 RepID=N1PU42_DOTSN|nr:hypothetical protein DOTSEDRAFT_22063 [Dothistroma septosporum NZE10]
MLVNKQFYQEANEACFRSKTLDCGHINDSTTLDMTQRFLEIWLQVHDTSFYDFQTKFVFLDTFNDDDFGALACVKDVLESKALHTVHLTAKRSRAAESEEEHTQCEKNVAALESCFNRDLKRIRAVKKLHAEKEDAREPYDAIDATLETRGIKRGAEDHSEGRLSKSVKGEEMSMGARK